MVSCVISAQTRKPQDPHQLEMVGIAVREIVVMFFGIDRAHKEGDVYITKIIAVVLNSLANLRIVEQLAKPENMRIVRTMVPILRPHRLSSTGTVGRCSLSPAKWGRWHSTSRWSRGSI